MSASARPCRRRGHGGTGIGTLQRIAVSPRSTTRSCAMRCRPARSCRKARRSRWCPICRSAAITRCILSSSTPNGTMLVDVASATNSCQVKNRTLKSPGDDPCKELETRGGIWRYDANKTNQNVFAGRALCDRHSQWRRLRDRCDGQSLRHAARTRSAAHELAGLLQAGSGGDAAGGRSAAAEKRRRLRLAGVLLRFVRAEAGARSGIRRRRRQEAWAVRQQDSSGRGVPGTLGAERHGALRQEAIPRALSRRRVYRVPRIVESRSLSAKRLQRRVPADVGRPRFRALRNFRRRICRRNKVAGEGRASSVGTRGRSGRCAVCFR